MPMLAAKSLSRRLVTLLVQTAKSEKEKRYVQTMGTTAMISYSLRTDLFWKIIKWDEISLDKVLLTLFSEDQKEKLQEENFWGDYVLDLHSVCYRTQVAVRLLCMPIQTWRDSMKSGFDDYDEYQGAADAILQMAMTTYIKAVYKTLEQVSKLGIQLAHQKEMLGKRWKQILLLVSTAIDRLESQSSK